MRGLFGATMRSDNFNTTEIASPARKLYFPYVDLARAAAVTLVVVYHLIVKLDWSAFPSSWGFNVFRMGWMGVDLFFVISGFVISMSLSRNMEDFGQSGYIKPYFRNRLARIVPLYFLTSWCFLVLVEPQWFVNPPQQLWTNILSHAFFVHNLSPFYAGALNGPAWSIGVEMQFYVCMALVFRWLPLHRPFLVCLVFIAAALVWRAGVWYTFNPALDISIMVSRGQQFPGALDAFGLGCAMALIVRDRQHGFHKYLQAGWRNSTLWFAIALILSVTSWKILWSYRTYWDLPAMVLFFRSLLALTFSCWICFLVALPKRRLLVRVLSPLLYIGKVSYGVYLWHMLVILSVAKIGITHPAQAAMLVVLLTLAISSFTWHFFEQPLIRKYHDKPGTREHLSY